MVPIQMHTATDLNYASWVHFATLPFVGNTTIKWKYSNMTTEKTLLSKFFFFIQNQIFLTETSKFCEIQIYCIKKHQQIEIFVEFYRGAWNVASHRTAPHLKITNIWIYIQNSRGWPSRTWLTDKASTAGLTKDQLTLIFFLYFFLSLSVCLCAVARVAALAVVVRQLSSAASVWR